jgi:hypothetical protein
MPKIDIPVTITLDLPAAAEWADIFKAVDEVKQRQQPTVQTVAPAAARKLTPYPAAVLERIEQGGNHWVKIPAIQKHLKKTMGRSVSVDAVHQHIHVLRKLLGSDAIESHPNLGGGYRLAKEAS